MKFELSTTIETWIDTWLSIGLSTLLLKKSYENIFLGVIKIIRQMFASLKLLIAKHIYDQIHQEKWDSLPNFGRFLWYLNNTELKPQLDRSLLGGKTFVSCKRECISITQLQYFLLKFNFLKENRHINLPEVCSNFYFRLQKKA